MGGSSLPTWLAVLLASAAVASISLAGVLVYRWRMRQEMASEIRAIMREYMPLDTSDAELGQGLLGRSKRRPGGDATLGGSIPAGYAPPAPRDEGRATELAGK